jgi:hypothetical protein
LKKLLITLFFLFFPTLSSAGNFDIGLSMASGITDSQSFHLEVQSKIKKIFIASRFNYGEQNNKETENKGFLRSGYDLKINEKFSLWFFDQAGYNKQRKIDFENFFGGGPKYNLSENFSVSVGCLHHYLKNESDSFNVSRLSLRFKGKLKIFSTVIFYQPNLNNFDDYIFTGEASVKKEILEKLSLKLLLIDQYRSISEISEKNELSLILSVSFEL